MILIIADDLTGANDTGVQYRKMGFSTIVQVTHDAQHACDAYSGCDVLSINADTRPLSSADAYAKVYGIAKQANETDVEYIYKKIDSVLRGNPASELDAVMDATDAEIALVAPSFPQNGRCIRNGLLKVGEKTIDVLGVFAQGMKRKVQAVALEEVAKGAQSLAQTIQEGYKKGAQVFVLDACTNEEIEIIKDASKLMAQKKVLCGSAGLASSLSKEGAPALQEQQAAEAPSKATLVVVGSRCNETATQVKELAEACNCPIVLVDTARIIAGEGQQIHKQCVNELLASFQKGKNLAILAVDSLFEDFTIQLRNSTQENAQALQIVEHLSAMVKAVFVQTQVDALICTGGDTSLQICRAFHTEGIELTDEVVPGIPAGRMVGGTANNLRIVTKSGGFGNGNALAKVVEYLQQPAMQTIAVR